MKEAFEGLQSEAKEAAHRIWLAGLGALSVAGEEGTKLFKNLVDKGSEYEGGAKDPVAAAKKTYDKTREATSDLFSQFEDGFNDKVVNVLQKLGVPTREDMVELNKKVDALTEAINKLIPPDQT